MPLINPDYNQLRPGAAVSATDKFGVFQGPNDRYVTGDQIKTYATSSYTASAAEINLNDDLPATFTFAPAAGASNVCEVTITAKDAAGVTMSRPVLFVLWLSDTATGLGLAATAASGAVAVKGTDGFDIGILTAKKAFICQTKGDGTYILSITDTSKTLYYVAASPLMSTTPSVSAKLVTGNYGA